MVEELTHKSAVLEAGLERTSKQLKEATMVAGDKTGKCKAAKEVIKSLTAQLKETAENVPQESTENRGSPTLVPNRENLSNLILAEAESNGDSAHSPVQNGLREQTEPKGRAPNDVLLYQGCHT